jgi:dipeptidase D
MEQSFPYAGLEPGEVWRHFAALNGIPRPSGAEAAAREYVLRVAAEAGAQAAVDARGNAVVRVPATVGREDAPVVAVQAHLDMVCEKRPGVDHNFATDPIRPRVDGDRVFASGTTLGSDNGIGAACALAMLTDTSVAHGPLELIFTVEEETGLHGARELDAGLVEARLLVNLDSEDPRELTIGCAGGAGAVLSVPVQTEPAVAGGVAYEVMVSGLKGGHSGVQIHEPLANAIKLLTYALLQARAAGVQFSIAGIRGGNAHNAIPRDAVAVILISPDTFDALRQSVAATEAELAALWKEHEPGLALRVGPLDVAPELVLTPDSRERLLVLLDQLPHGVLRWSTVFPGKVETSANLAQVNTHGAEVEIGTSTRSFVEPELERVQIGIAALGSQAGVEVRGRDGYPGWEPDPNSQLLAVTRAVYEREFGVAPEVQVIHAGLECGVIVSKLPGMEAISFGPRIEGAHTPEEHVYVSTVASTWRLLTALLAELAG